MAFSRSKLSGQIAQLVEQRIENPRVGGSIPSLATLLRQLHCHLERFLSILDRTRVIPSRKKKPTQCCNARRLTTVTRSKDLPWPLQPILPQRSRCIYTRHLAIGARPSRDADITSAKTSPQRGLSVSSLGQDRCNLVRSPTLPEMSNAALIGRCSTNFLASWAKV